MKHKGLILLIAIIVFFLFTSFANKLSDGVDEQFIIEDIKKIEAETTPNDLSKNQIGIYTKLILDIESYKTESIFNNIEVDDVIKAYKAVAANHPEFFWINNGCTYEVSDTGSQSNIKILYSLNSDISKVEAMKTHLDSITARIIDTANYIKNDYEKIIFLHDYLVNNTEYDYDALNNPDKDSMSSAYNAYGCLCKNRAVCSGYSAAFQLLAKDLGFDCGRVSGEKVDGGSHEWNYICIDGDYYYVDVTWDDPVSFNSKSDRVSHEFLCITTDEIINTHIIDNDQFVPSCISKKYDYYKYIGAYLDEYSIDEFVNAYRKSNSVKFSSKDELNKAVNDLIVNGNIYNIVDSTSLTYSLGTLGMVLTIE